MTTTYECTYELCQFEFYTMDYNDPATLSCPHCQAEVKKS